MAELSAGQHLYANVEADQSPRGRGGFQTLFHSPEVLTESEVSELEGRLPYYPSPGNPIKRLFFSLSTGKIVVGQVAPLSEADSAGRKGRYLAHSLVFSRKAFVASGADPFAVFRSFPFAVTLPEAMSRGEFATGHAPTVTVTFGAEHPQTAEANDWAPAALLQLVLLALRADELARRRAPVAFVGPPESMENALRVVWSVLPTELRPACTFDTYFHRCNLVATYYWGIGLLEEPANPDLPVVDAGRKQVSRQDPTPPRTCYERWAAAALSEGELATAAAHRDEAFALCELLEGRQPTRVDLLDAVSEELVKSVFTVNSDVLKRLVRARLREAVPAALVERLAAPVLDELAPRETLDRLRTGYDPAELLDLLYAVYEKHGFAPPGSSERKALAQLLSGRPDERLAPLLACWSHNMSELNKALAPLDDDAYGRIVELALRHQLTGPWQTLLPGRGAVFARRYLRVVPPGKRDLPGLARALVESRNAESLSVLTPHLNAFTSADLRRLHALLDHTAGAPDSFRAAVAAARNASPPPRGVSGMIRRLFGRD